MAPDRIEAFATALLQARRTGSRYPQDPAREPATLDEAYEAQALVARALSADVAGWKVGYAPDGTPVAAPMFRDGFQGPGAQVALRGSRAPIVEVELAFRLARDLPPRAAPYTREEVLAACDVALVGLELIAGRVGEPGDVAFPVWLADNIGNLGYVTGDQTPDIGRLDFAALRCRLRIGGETVHDCVGGHPQHDPVEPFRAWASAQRDRLGGLKRGQVVTTGSLTGATRVARATVVDADLAGIGAVTLDVRQK